ncbi:DTW domain-containing protein [Desulfosporosinus fructosivorans]|uniref:tRNA-uridine aminocarboxypropyltransferase n=1 Tax=Desulfosporosinus fructosivorans TaxID=2018669 RepID=A0A4Z0R1Z2_9FIRM|nr:DTW domain-containing protein [Desulfosporosinus fructosivorans]TGE36017.1 DTW domain-containing protein [Desulfosporosinus fructosivorans]
MDKIYRVKHITSLYESCDKCGLPTINCICNKSVKVRTQAKLWILSSEREFYRPSNTARLLKVINPESTEIFLWERTKSPDKLIKYMSMEEYKTFVVFPTENEELEKRKVEFKLIDKIPAFIIIDGTWKEARKIFRKSDFLEGLPIVSIERNYASNYDLRRGATEGNLCTIEAAIEILKMNGEMYSSQVMDDYYNLFLKCYKAGVSGHIVKKDKEG